MTLFPYWSEYFIANSVAGRSSVVVRFGSVVSGSTDFTTAATRFSTVLKSGLAGLS